jgi:hypothetical protein
MVTQYYKTRLVMVALLFALLLSGCGPTLGAQATVNAVYEQARIATNGTLTLENGASYGDITPDVIAVNAVLTAQPGAYALINNAQNLAIFISPAGTNAQGVTYYLYGVINTSRTCLVDAERALVGLGIDSSKLRTLEELKTVLRSRGFEELTPATAPALIATLRLAMGWLKTKGAEAAAGMRNLGLQNLSQLLVVPTLLLTPEMLNPYCGEEIDCDANPIEQ